MSTKKRLDLKETLQRSGEKFLDTFRSQLNMRISKGYGIDGRVKSSMGPFQGNSIASGDLATKSTFEIVEFGKGYDLIFSFPDYVYFLEYGVKPKGFERGKKRGNGGGGDSPFIKSLITWINLKGISTMNPRGLAYAIRTNIFKYGIKPTHILSNTIDEFTKKYINEIGDAQYEYIDEYISMYLKELENKYYK